MLYYKIVSADNKIIGAEMGDMLRYVKTQERNGLQVLTKEVADAFGLAYDGKIYQLESVTLTPISVDEYNMIIAAKQAAESEDDAAFSMENTVEEEDRTTLEYVRESKLKELSATCQKTIEKGVDIALSDGESYHFSLTAHDQLNLLTLSAMATAGQSNIPYHADGELCRFYSAEDILSIVTTAAAFITKHTAYYNSLKAYVLALTSLYDVEQLEYGAEVPDEYCSVVYKKLKEEVAE